MILSSIAVAVLVAAAPAPKPKLAAPGLEGLNLEPKALEIFSEHFATQFTFHGVDVTTPAQISAVLGLERQKQLLGCSDDSSCMSEIGDALGVDGILTGSIAKIEDVFQLNLRIVAPTDATPLATYSNRIDGTQKRLLTELESAARVMAGLFKKKLAERKAASAVATAPAKPLDVKPAGGPDTPAAAAVQPASATSAAAAVQPAVQPASPSPKPQAAQAATSPAAVRKNRLSLGVVAMAVGLVPLEFERAVGSHLSLMVGTMVLVPIFSTAAGFGGTLGTRWYPAGPAPSGFWLGPELTASFGSGGTTGGFASAGAFGMLGYTFISGGGFSASAGAGLGLGYNLVTGVPGPAGNVHANLGWAF